ncbi:hypothetical protein M0R36_10560 [bacterium]|jgi:hypothetical protein|nr:hypothetical protein [bacterium]
MDDKTNADLIELTEYFHEAGRLLMWFCECTMDGSPDEIKLCVEKTKIFLKETEEELSKIRKGY